MQTKCGIRLPRGAGPPNKGSRMFSVMALGEMHPRHILAEPRLAEVHGFLATDKRKLESVSTVAHAKRTQ